MARFEVMTIELSNARHGRSAFFYVETALGKIRFLRCKTNCRNFRVNLRNVIEREFFVKLKPHSARTFRNIGKRIAVSSTMKIEMSRDCKSTGKAISRRNKLHRIVTRIRVNREISK